MGRAVGIDLGTSFCVAAVIENKLPVVVPNRDVATIPSILCIID